MTADPPRTTPTDADTAAAFVRANSSLRPVPMVPEITLYLADDAISVWEASERDAGQAELPPPFWALDRKSVV